MAKGGVTARKRFKRAWLGIAVAVVLAAVWSQVRVLRALENMTEDWRVARFNSGQTASPDIIVLDVDDPSIKFMNEHYGYGRWPLRRNFYKDLLEYLRQCQVKGVFFDVLFTEGENRGNNDDAVFADMLKAMPEASMAMVFQKDAAIQLAKGVDAVPLAALVEERAKISVQSDDGRAGFDRGFRDFLAPQEPLLSASGGLHAVNTEIDFDGRYRSEPLLVRYQGQAYPSLTLAALIRYFSDEKGKPGIAFENGQLVLSRPGNHDVLRRIPLHHNGLMDVSFYTRDKEPKSLPVAPVIQAAEMLRRGDVEDPAALPVQPDELKDKIVLVGTSAIGASDLKDTPVDNAQAGVLIHATAISNIIQNNYVHRPRGTTLRIIEVLLALFLAGLSYFSVFSLRSSFARFSLPLLGLALVLSSVVMMFRFSNTMLPFVLPAVILILSLVDAFAYMTFVEGRERKRMQENLSKYLPPAVIEEMIASGKDLQAEVGKKENLSVLFSDIRGFTTLSERLSPEMVVSILNEYLDAMTRVIFANGGTLDKFIGDAVMAFWGAPITRPTHARESVAGALAMIDELHRLQALWATRPSMNGITLEIGVGINTGEVVVGNIGGEKKLDYTVIGDNVNLASRLEGLTKQYGVTLVIAESTFKAVQDFVICRVVDRVQVKGKLNAVTIYEPLALRSDPRAAKATETAVAFDSYFKSYCEGDFASALKGFERGRDKLSHLYVKRCQEFIKVGTPPDWDGTYVAQSK